MEVVATNTRHSTSSNTPNIVTDHILQGSLPIVHNSTRLDHRQLQHSDFTLIPRWP